MFLVGLTGGIASGKSVVASMFQDYGIPIISADEIAREGEIILQHQSLNFDPYRLKSLMTAALRL